MDLEEFIDLKDFEGLYKINRKGEILGLKYNKILKQRLNNDGYYCIDLSKNAKKKNLRIHRLIALNFLENPDNLPEIDHIDRNRTNNNIENLRWVSRDDNQKNKGIKGCIHEYDDKRRKNEAPYFQVWVRKKYLKSFKIREDAEEFLKKYLEENEN